eukprot:GHUV01013340.1.p3 GENE.GHUV01013340.1~~GHUV01013340.1.p3  ORF type:complete len:117 (+),score=11.07 GHUV01013340.1:161-511(+)
MHSALALRSAGRCMLRTSVGGQHARVQRVVVRSGEGVPDLISRDRKWVYVLMHSFLRDIENGAPHPTSHPGQALLLQIPAPASKQPWRMGGSSAASPALSQHPGTAVCPYVLDWTY